MAVIIDVLNNPDALGLFSFAGMIPMIVGLAFTPSLVKKYGIYKVNTYTGGGLRDVNHPSYQAMTYANLIRDYNESVQLQDINVVPCAYLHNYYFDNI